MIHNSKKQGFSFIEILVVLAVLAIVVAFGATAFLPFYRNQILNGALEQVVALINEARSKTLSSEDASQYGVHFETSKITLFKGTIFSESNPDNQEFKLPSSVEISEILLNGGGPDLVFKRLTGETNQFGRIGLKLKADTPRVKSITIETSGLVNID